MQYFIPHKNALVELTVEHMQVCSILCGSLDMREVWGRMDTGIFMAKPLYTLPEITRILLLLSSLSFFFFTDLFTYFSLSSIFLQCRACYQLGGAGANQYSVSPWGGFPEFGAGP